MSFILEIYWCQVTCLYQQWSSPISYKQWAKTFSQQWKRINIVCDELVTWKYSDTFELDDYSVRVTLFGMKLQYLKTCKMLNPFWVVILVLLQATDFLL